LEHCSQWLKVVSKSINEVMINNVGGMLGGRGWGWERPANGGPSFLLEEDDVLQLFRKFDANRPGTSWYNCCLSLTIWYGQNVDMFARDDSVSQEETCNVRDPLSAFFETLEINT
jgi:hypothetical protein